MSTTMALCATGLSKEFGGVTRVDGVDLEMAEGEAFALLGPNGAGKTTTIRMLSTLLAPTRGRASIFGHDIVREARAARALIAVSPQENALSERLSVAENLDLAGGLAGLGRTESRRRAMELTERLGLGERLREESRRLSGGQRRKLSLAMALIAEPRLLFLDEPTVGLDPASRRELWTIIEGLKGRTTILLTTHYLEEADSLADRVAFIREGRIVATGSPSVLKERYAKASRMRVAMHGDLDAFAALLAGRFEGVVAGEDGIGLRASPSDFEEIAGLARSAGFKVDGISAVEPSLDDVFFAVTAEGRQS